MKLLVLPGRTLVPCLAVLLGSHLAFGQVNSGTLNFGNVTVGTTSAPIKIGPLENDGLGIWRFTLSNTNFGIYQPGTTCPISQGIVPQYTTCVLYVVFKPQSVGPLTGVLSLHDSSATLFSDVTNIWNLTGTGVPAPPPPSACDLNADGTTDVRDVQLEVNKVLAFATGAGDLNGDGQINVLDLQRLVNAVLGLGCNTAH